MMDGVRGIPDQIWVAELIQPGSASVVDNQYGQFFPLFGNCLHTPATEPQPAAPRYGLTMDPRNSNLCIDPWIHLL